MQAKAHKTPFPPSSSIAKQIGNLTHADICSVGVKSTNGGATMFLNLTDDNSRFNTITLLQAKDEAVEAIIKYDLRLFNKTGHHMHILRCDGGGEFINSRLKDYFQKNGIILQKSTRYSPEQNGNLEQRNFIDSRTLYSGIPYSPKGS